VYAGDLPKTDKGWQAFLMSVQPGSERNWVSLGSGLRVCVEASGVKTFEARVRRRGERNPRTVRIGSFPAISVDDARRALLEIKSIAREGRDPALEARRARAGVGAVRTLRDLIDEYLSRRDGQVAKKTLKGDSDLLRGVLAPALGARLLSDLGPADIGKVVGDYAARLRLEGRSRGTNANKLLKATRRMFKLAHGWGLILAMDPTAGRQAGERSPPRSYPLRWRSAGRPGPEA
jgi:hypothetical protein